LTRSLAAFAALASAAAHAHVVSMSSGELNVEGRRASYELRMPMYELQHVALPERALLDQVKFGDGRRTAGSCRQDRENYVCSAAYEFARPVPDKLEVECTLFRVTVPNHVHLLRATQGSNADQAVFDQRFTRAEVRFRPPSPAEVFARQVFSGAGQLLRSVTGLLFLAALALAARSWREGALLAAMFLAGEWAARPLAPRVPIPLAPAFLDAATALTSAYLAVDVLLLPQSRARWMPVPVLGLIHGLPFAAFPAGYLAGASSIQILAVALATAAALRLPDMLRRILTAGVLAAGLGWFVRLLLR
jgi:hypothetical protein